MTPYFEDTQTTLYCGDAMTVLPQLPVQRVQCVVTSPPYFGLRAYGTTPQVWDDPGDCVHVWDARRYYVVGGGAADSSKEAFSQPGAENAARIKHARWREDAFCQRCQAWRGDLGLEPTIDLYVSHLVQIFREVRRVLRDDGVMWLNLGDSYMGGGGGNYGKTSKSVSGRDGVHLTNVRNQQSFLTSNRLKAKDLAMIPARVALALQADGWTLRNEIPWVKWNGMPESVQDRATVSHETVFLFSKGSRYFWDMEAIRRLSARPDLIGKKHLSGVAGLEGQRNDVGRQHDYCHPNGRNRRTGDWYTESLDEAIAATEAWVAHAKQVRAQGGMLLDPEGEPLGFLVNPQSYPEAHFATFSPKLITPMIQASTSEKGCCHACGAPWERWREKIQEGTRREVDRGFPGNPQASGGSSWTPVRYIEKGWQPSCACDAGAPGPCTVLDPFAGSGTSLHVARTLGRRAIGIELNPQYCALTMKELAQGVFAFEA